jgi:RNA polymerase sigma factor (sigma-70 family)
MAHVYPAVLSRLLPEDRTPTDEAWGDFVASHSKLILYVARSLGGNHDAVMDRYACILEQLRADNYRRLRTYAADGRSEFTTWLVVVAQRICLDDRRARYGRFRQTDRDSAAKEEEWAARRRLVDLVSADIDLSTLSDGHVTDADDRLRVTELYHALEAALVLLDPRDRLLVKLRFEDDLPVVELVRTLGFPTRFHFYRRLSQVLDLLRHSLQTSGVRDPVP